MYKLPWQRLEIDTASVTEPEYGSSSITEVRAFKEEDGSKRWTIKSVKRQPKDTADEDEE